MPEKINWTVTVQVVGGPKLSEARTLEVEAYDLLEVEVPDGDETTPGRLLVNVQPGGAGQVKFLMISSDLYHDALTYTVDGDPTEVHLNDLQLFIGGGAVTLLGDTQNQFAFVNRANQGRPAFVKILVGRKATA